MVEPKLVEELVLRTGVSRADAEAVLTALGDLTPERVSQASRPAGPWREAADPHEVEALIAAAEQHPLGLDFLLHGDQAAVAVTFQVHAFSVDAARERLGRRAD